MSGDVSNKRDKEEACFSYESDADECVELEMRPFLAEERKEKVSRRSGSTVMSSKMNSSSLPLVNANKRRRRRRVPKSSSSRYNHNSFKLYRRLASASLKGENKFQSLVEDYSTSHSPLFRNMSHSRHPRQPKSEEEVSLLNNFNKNSTVIPPTIHEVDDEENDDNHDADNNNYVVEDLIIDPVLGVMDRLEDEIDGHAYDNFLPLPLRVILEEQVFGWSHLFSAFIGHVAFTSLAYLFTYHILNFIFLHKVPLTQNHLTQRSQHQHSHSPNQQNDQQLCFNSIRCFIYDIADIIFHNQHHNTSKHMQNAINTNNITYSLHPANKTQSTNLLYPYNHNSQTTTNTTHHYQNTPANYGNGITLQGNTQWEYQPRWHFITHDKFVAMRLVLSILMAISAFRTVRRRRQVWLRYSYGSKEYWQDEATRRKRVKQTDQQTILGKIRHTLIQKRNRWLINRVQRKIKRAQSRFERKKQKELQTLDLSTNNNLQDGPILKDDEDDWSESETSSIITMLTEEEFMHSHSINYNYALDDDLVDGDSFFQDDNNINNDATKTSKSSLVSITRDQIPFASGFIQNVPYAHGGFFGAAPFMLANPQWIDILRHLMPDVYVELSHRVLHTPVSKLILWAENNPVVAAYGTAYEILRKPQQKYPKITPLEWDVFLDPHLVQQLEFLLQQRDKFITTSRRCKHQQPHHSGKTQTEHANAQSMEKEHMKKIKETQILLNHYDEQIQQRTRVLVEQMLIAHGNLNQLILEQTGFLKSYNFSRIKRTRRTLGGGIFAMNWCAVYAHALQLGLLQQTDQESYKSSCHTSKTENDSLISLSSHRIQTSRVKFDDASSQSTIESDVDYLLDSDVDEDDSSHCCSISSFDSSIPSCIDNSVADNDQYNDAQLDSNLVCPRSPSILSHRSKAQNENHRLPKNSNSQSLVSPIHKKMTMQKSVSSTSLNELALTNCPSWSISESISLLKTIMVNYTRDGKYDDERKDHEELKPLSLVLDLKSRHVPKRVWALVVDTLQEAGIKVEGIASFNLDEIRDISKYCKSAAVSEIYFFHSAGEMQTACHAGLLNDCRCYFNAGNLLWEKPESHLEYFYNGKKTIISTLTLKPFNAEEAKRGYKFKTFAKIRNGDCMSPNNDISNNICNVKIVFEDGNGSTIQDYKEKYNLSIGLYCQEFAIDDAAISLIVQYVNDNPHVYNLGLSWGGINGVTVRGIQPGRVTNTDGFWNQRYGGVRWNSQIYP